MSFFFPLTSECSNQINIEEDSDDERPIVQTLNKGQPKFGLLNEYWDRGLCLSLSLCLLGQRSLNEYWDRGLCLLVKHTEAFVLLARNDSGHREHMHLMSNIKTSKDKKCRFFFPWQCLTWGAYVLYVHCHSGPVKQRLQYVQHLDMWLVMYILVSL